MTSEERREGRYQRRMAARRRKIQERNKPFEEVFSFENLYKGYLRSRKGKIELRHIDNTMASINGHLKRADSFNARKNLKALYTRELLKFPPIYELQKEAA